MLLTAVPLSWGRTGVLGSVRKVARVRPNEIESYQEFISLAEAALEAHGLSPVSTAHAVVADLGDYLNQVE